MVTPSVDTLVSDQTILKWDELTFVEEAGPEDVELPGRVVELLRELLEVGRLQLGQSILDLGGKVSYHKPNIIGV